MTCVIIEDNGILWLQREKVGTPAAWEPGRIYNVGDLVVPRAPTEAQANMMFQCIGFQAVTGPTAPAFPSDPDVGEALVHDNVEYIAQPTSEPPLQLADNQYYLIDRTITVV